MEWTPKKNCPNHHHHRHQIIVTVPWTQKTDPTVQFSYYFSTSVNRTTSESLSQQARYSYCPSQTRSMFPPPVTCHPTSLHHRYAATEHRLYRRSSSITTYSHR
ncbi:hypothetical protein HanRHA438_Chr06g0256471 [Helianthus annuus]|nr:hypothetical protein HanRHA438_Chr06g0256471 [Helianthus annuus]